MEKSHLSSKKAYSLLEILVTITILILLLAALFFIFNPKAQINKGNDGKKKTELSGLKKIFEDWYNDKNCYPKPNEVCYNDTGGTTCNICGNEPTSPSFSPYLSRLPCDPLQPTKKYLYQVDDAACPTWYRIYTTLLNTSDPAIVSVGCQYGCGPSPDFNYNYGVSSPNIGLETDNNLCSLASNLYVNPFCNICGTYAACKISHPDDTYYTDSGSCLITCIKD